MDIFFFKCWQNIKVSEHVTLAYAKNSNYLCAKISVTVKGATEKEKVIKKTNKKKRTRRIGIKKRTSLILFKLFMWFEV